MAFTHCSKCGDEWPADQVPQIRMDMSTPGERTTEGCPNCGTDAHLMDTNEPTVAR